jgi:hypothetical protein
MRRSFQTGLTELTILIAGLLFSLGLAFSVWIILAPDVG